MRGGGSHTKNEFKADFEEQYRKRKNTGEEQVTLNVYLTSVTMNCHIYGADILCKKLQFLLAY